MDGRDSPPVALVWRGDAETRRGGGMGRFGAVAAALREAGLAPQPCPYDESLADAVREQLLGCAAALVWINPVQDGRRRHALDALLEEVAAAGVLVSGRPEVIRRLGVKSVLWRTREIGWSGDARFYGAPHELADGLPASLASGPRVLKPNRGNGGQGVWKVSAATPGRVEVQAATGAEGPRVVALETFLGERLAEFEAAGGFVDQAFQPRLSEGMIRCYMSGSCVAGFGWQLVRALAPPELGPAEPRTYSGPDDPRFQTLRRRMEGEWTPALLRLLDLAADDLPAIWDADFLFGPKDADGQDTFVLCEINASCVSPMPDEAPPAIAALVADRLAAGARNPFGASRVEPP